jgi:hypothetical protein
MHTMPSASPRSLLDCLLGLAFTVLVVAVMLHVAAGLLEAAWQTLAIGGGVTLLLFGGVALLRVVIARRRYW